MVKVYIDKLNAFSDSLPVRSSDTSISRTSEVDALAGQLAERHNPTATTVACLWLLSSAILDHYHVSKGVNTQPLKDMLCDALKLWCDKNGAPVADALAAVHAIQQSGEVAGYLAALPD